MRIFQATFVLMCVLLFGAWIHGSGTGIVADGFVGTDGAMSFNSTTLSSAGRYCSAIDYASTHVVVVAGAGSASGDTPLHTVVDSCSGNDYVLHDKNLNTSGVTADMWAIGTDDSTYINNLVAANPNQQVQLPCGSIVLDAQTIALDHVWFAGCGNPGQTNNLASNLGSQTMLIVTSASVQPVFTVSRSVRTSDFNMIWPGQYGVATTPVVYGPAFADNGSNIMTAWYLDHVTFLNAYDVFKQDVASLAISTIHWDNVKAYAVHRTIDMSANGEEFVISNSAVNPNVSTAIASSGYAGAGNLRTWSWNNADFFYGHGTGTSGAACSSQHAAVNLDHVEVYGVNIGIHLVGAVFPEAEMTGLDFGNVNQFINADSGSEMNGVEVVGSILQIGNTTTVPMIDYEGNCTSASDGGLNLTGNNWVGQNGGFYVNAAGNMKQLIITDSKISTSITSPAGSEPLLYLNAANADLIFSNNRVKSAFSSTNATGVVLIAETSALINSNEFSKYYVALDTSGLTGGPITFDDNVSLTSGGTFSVNVPTAAAVQFSGNFLDTRPTWTITNLGTCAPSNEGNGPYEVTDANAVTFNGTVANGGALKAFVYCQSGAWKMH